MLEDFVRWYSPRDWIEDNEEEEQQEGDGEEQEAMETDETEMDKSPRKSIKGVLSQRMQVNSNSYINR